MKKYSDLNQPLQHLPERLLSIAVKCSKCGNNIVPPWLEKRNTPLLPVRPNKSPGIWRPLTALIKCPNCNAENHLAIPQKTINATYNLFGDEGYREVDDKMVLCYTVVGTNSRFLPIIENQINEFKQSIFPDRKPNEWNLHMKDIWSSGNRKKSIFKDHSFSQIQDLVNSYFRIISSFNNGFIAYCFSAIVKKPNKVTKNYLNQHKIDIYSLLIARIIEELTDQKIKPVFIFDSEKIGDSNNIIHEWAERAFLGAQHSLLYSYISGANEIEKPAFVKPGSYPCLEVADFISYVIARYCFKKLQNQAIDLNPCSLGKMYYLGYEKGTDFRYVFQDSYPWKLFYD